jgi:hypothetical protein
MGMEYPFQAFVGALSAVEIIIKSAPVFVNCRTGDFVLLEHARAVPEGFIRG